MSGMEMMIISGVMTAAQTAMQMNQAKAQAEGVRRRATIEAQLQQRQAQAEINRLEFEEKITTLELGLKELQVPLKELETRSQVAAAELETAGAMKTLLATLAATNAHSASGMVDLGLGPTIEALDVGLGDIYAGRDAVTFRQISGNIEAERLRSEITFGGAKIEQLRTDQQFIESTLPLTTNAIIQGGRQEASRIRQDANISALSNAANFGMNAASSGLFRGSGRTGGRPLSTAIPGYRSFDAGYA